MKEGHEATKVQVSIPQGLELQSVNTQGHAYGTGGFDADARMLSIDLQGADKRSATIYLGLLATSEAASMCSLSASVTSGAASAPLGSAIVNASALIMEVPKGLLSSPTFVADVYAAPKTTVRFRVGQTDLDTQVTTNLVGHATATLTIPNEEVDMFSLYAVTALATTEDGTDMWTTERIEYEAGVSAWSTREWELSFVHGGKTNYLVKDGEPILNPYYTCYALTGHAPAFFSPTWPFTSIIDSDRALANKQTLTLKMLDGSMRSETMTLVKKQPLEGDTVRYTYLASVPIGDGDPFHDLLAKDIPCGFEVLPEYEDPNTVPEPPALTQANVNNLKLLLRKKSADLHDRIYALRNVNAAENPSYDTEGILESHIFSGEYRNVMAGIGRIADPDVRQAILSSTEISEQLREAFRAKYEELDELNAQYAQTMENALDLLQKMCGSLCGGPAAPLILGVGVTMYAGNILYNYIQSGYRSGHQQDYEAKKSLREAACGDKKNTKHKAKTGIDPSGYVYEAVDDNRVEGATATIQYSTDGGETWAAWDEAEKYEQTRTQVTDAAGTFAWDVPMGLWRVAFEAEGYENAYTAAMEVPPARTGLAIPIVSVLSPAVESVTADDQYVEVVFKQYMDTSVLPAITMAGQALTGGSWVDPSPAPNADATYARAFKVPVPAGTKLGSTLPASVSDAVNYAGRALEPAWTGDVTVAPRAAQIVLDYAHTVTHVVGTTRDVAIQVLDAGGKPLEGASVTATASNAKLATVVGDVQRTDQTGRTTASVQALLPGSSKLTIAVAGTSLARTVDLVATLESRCEDRYLQNNGKVIVTIY